MKKVFRTKQDTLPIQTKVQVVEYFAGLGEISFRKYKEAIEHKFNCKSKKEFETYLETFDDYDMFVFEEIADFYNLKAEYIETRPSKGEGYFVLYKDNNFVKENYGWKSLKTKDGYAWFGGKHHFGLYDYVPEKVIENHSIEDIDFLVCGWQVSK